MRKVYITATFSLILNIDEGMEVQEAMSELFLQAPEEATQFDVDDTTLKDFEITDSK